MKKVVGCSKFLSFTLPQPLKRDCTLSEQPKRNFLYLNPRDLKILPVERTEPV